jgi:ABC-2 type transport system permease protein
MNAWRLEWLRATRSRRGFILAAVYVFFGLVGPLMAKYMPQLVKYASSQITIIAPAPRPEHGIVNFVNQVGQTGLIVTVVVISGALCFDARRGLAIFYRTRAPGPFALIWPRFVAGATLAVAAYVLGTVAAWLETSFVLGELSTVRVLQGVILEAVFLVFAVAVVAAASTVVRSTLSTVGIAFGVLFVVLPIAGIIADVGPWLPTKLLNAPAALVTGSDFDAYFRSLAMSVAATAGLLAFAVNRARHRDL